MHHKLSYFVTHLSFCHSFLVPTTPSVDTVNNTTLFSLTHGVLMYSRIIRRFYWIMRLFNSSNSSLQHFEDNQIQY